MDFLKFQLIGAHYNDQNIFEKETVNIFNKAWQYVCRESDLSAVGSYVTATLGTEPIIVFKASDGTLR